MKYLIILILILTACADDSASVFIPEKQLSLATSRHHLSREFIEVEGGNFKVDTTNLISWIGEVYFNDTMLLSNSISDCFVLSGDHLFIYGEAIDKEVGERWKSINFIFVKSIIKTP